MNEMKILSVKKDIYNDISINVKFEKNGQKAEFNYVLFGQEKGIDICTYMEDKNEDIYADIHDWISENIEVNVEILHDGVKL